MNVLGINNMHDASACLVRDGKVIAAVEEERFTREKHMVGFPVNAIKHCLAEAGINIKDVDHIGLSWQPFVLRRRITEALKTLPKSFATFRAKASRGAGQMQNEWSQLFVMKKLIHRHFGTGKFELHYLNHHLCHAVSAFYPSQFDQAAILTVDGAGEEHTTVMWKGDGLDITQLKATPLPYSLGQFYAAITAFLGFKVQSDEYKVMGMSSYGKPEYADFFRKNIVNVSDNGDIKIDTSYVDYHLARQGIFLKKIMDVLGPNRLPQEEVTQKHMDIAKSAQVIIEEALIKLANKLYRDTGMNKLCLAGGVALNCVANGKILSNTEIREMFIQPAAGDAGTSLGAALYLYHKMTGEPRKFVMRDAYLGPHYSNEECKEALRKQGLSFEELNEDDLCNKVAQSIADGKVICWFQGKMEWGPRALGNRSLIADPRREEMREIINVKVKQREVFRPFAPSMLSEKSSEYLECTHPSPFMLFAFNVKEEKRNIIPAVTHIDGTARPQTVEKDTNPRYWKLISAFEKITGVPVLLNTSFNVQEPVVCTPEDAIKSFLKTKTDYLVLNNLLVKGEFQV